MDGGCDQVMTCAMLATMVQKNGCVHMALLHNHTEKSSGSNGSTQSLLLLVTSFLFGSNSISSPSTTTDIIPDCKLLQCLPTLTMMRRITRQIKQTTFPKKCPIHHLLLVTVEVAAAASKKAANTVWIPSIEIISMSKILKILLVAIQNGTSSPIRART